jgi:hypothetical protein
MGPPLLQGDSDVKLSFSGCPKIRFPPPPPMHGIQTFFQPNGMFLSGAMTGCIRSDPDCYTVKGEVLKQRTLLPQCSLDDEFFQVPASVQHGQDANSSSRDSIENTIR